MDYLVLLFVCIALSFGFNINKWVERLKPVDALVITVMGIWGFFMTLLLVHYFSLIIKLGVK